MATASIEVTRDLPTPPFPLTTPITLPICVVGCGSTRKLFLSPQVDDLQSLQLWLQFSLIFTTSFKLLSHFIFALLLSSFLPLILTVVVLRQAIFCVPFIFTFIKAFLYGFSLMIYSGAISGLFLFSQTCSCFLLLLLIFIQIYRPKFLSFRLCLVFLTVDLILIVLDYTVICPMYF